MVCIGRNKCSLAARQRTAPLPTPGTSSAAVGHGSAADRREATSPSLTHAPLLSHSLVSRWAGVIVLSLVLSSTAPCRPLVPIPQTKSKTKPKRKKASENDTEQTKPPSALPPPCMQRLEVDVPAVRLVQISENGNSKDSALVDFKTLLPNSDAMDASQEAQRQYAVHGCA
ncbi:hypothetical protein K438DRAFT_2000516 [Mycena galopus ATCC 62051]|nr:hypothetical protein K438DRAFT_2000516 [Mycena galopus ATCC 62051]